MSYKYHVYTTREEHFPMDNLLEYPIRDTISGTFFTLGLAGAASNALVLMVFYHFYRPWRITSKLWINVSLCCALLSFTLMVRALGDSVLWMSNSQLLCKLRMYTPVALDVTSIACMFVMLFDRLSVIHFLNLYIYNEKNNMIKIMYPWLLGATFFLYKFFVNEHDNIPYRCMTPFTLAFPLETVSMIMVGLVTVLLMVTILGLAFTPVVNSSTHHTWVEIETGEAIRVILFASISIILWTPKLIVVTYYLTQGIDDYKYQLWMTLLHIPPRLIPLLPIVILMRIPSFRQALWIVVGMAENKTEIEKQVAHEEANADHTLRSIAQALYPSHPEFKSKSGGSSKGIGGGAPSTAAGTSIAGKRPGNQGSFVKKESLTTLTVDPNKVEDPDKLQRVRSTEV